MTPTETPAFHRWFGKSKVVGKDKQPLVVYHGTVGDFTAFDPAKAGSKAKTGSPHGSFFFSDRPDVAASYTVEWSGDFSERHYEGGVVLPVYLRIEKPLKINAKGETWRDIEFKGEIVTTNDLAAYAQRHGYDGVIVSNVIDKGRGRVEGKAAATVYIALDPRQIKSATGNRGTFDPADPDIRHNPRAPKPRGRTLVERGMPTKWWHGTKTQFETIKPQSSGCVWLADRAGATEYATPSYSKPGERWLLELDLAPDTSIVELADASDPIVQAYIAALNEISPHWLETPEEWSNKSINYNYLERNRWSRGFFRKYGVDALIVRDVAGWGGYDSMPSLCLLNTKKIQQTQRHALNNPATARRTRPALWERIVDEVTAGDKGGLPGQWSARKAQLAVALYRQQGGGYIGPKSADNALAKWTREKWRTRSGRPSLVTGERYLPSKALAALSPQEYAATTRAKRAGMARGQQFVPQPERIAMKTAKYRKARGNGFSMDDFNFFPTEAAPPRAPDYRAQGREALEARSGVQAPIFEVYSVLKEPEPEIDPAGYYTAPYMKGIREVAWAVAAPRASTAAQATAAGKRLIQKMIPRTKLASHLPLLVGCPLYVAYPGGVVRIEPAAKRNPAPVRRARRNPNYPNVSVYRGVLTSPEGRIRVKQIGKGQFSVAYLSEEPRPRVFLFTSGDVYDKEILMFAHDRLPNNPHLPAVEAYGDTRDGKTVWTMPLYKAPLKKADNETAWKQYLALKRCREALYKPRGVKSGYQVNYDVYECAVAAGVSPKLANALEHLISTAADYDEEYVFEFSPRNLATDAEGHLVLLDVLYHRRMLFRKLGAAAARGF